MDTQDSAPRNNATEPDELWPADSATVNPRSDPGDVSPPPPPPRLLDRIREATRVRHYSIRTETAYVDWARRFILFHEKRHPAGMGPDEVTAFLTHLAVDRSVSASTQNQAKSALLFLYRVVLGVQLPWLDDVIAAKGRAACRSCSRIRRCAPCCTR